MSYVLNVLRLSEIVICSRLKDDTETMNKPNITMIVIEHLYYKLCIVSYMRELNNSIVNKRKTIK